MGICTIEMGQEGETGEYKAMNLDCNDGHHSGDSGNNDCVNIYDDDGNDGYVYGSTMQLMVGKRGQDLRMWCGYTQSLGIGLHITLILQ